MMVTVGNESRGSGANKEAVSQCIFSKVAIVNIGKLGLVLFKRPLDLLVLI